MSDVPESSQKKMSIAMIEEEVSERFANTLEFSWLQKGVLSDIRNQGRCGCCWTMPTTGAVEAKYLIDLRKSMGKEAELPRLQLAPQQLLDCLNPSPKKSETDAKGCYAASFRETYSYISNDGVHPEDKYPYEGEKGPCLCGSHQLEKVEKYFIEGTSTVPMTLKKIKKAIKKQPIAVAITLTKEKFTEFSRLTGGRIFKASTPLDIDKALYEHQNSKNKEKKDEDAVRIHGLLLVGFGKGYYLIKNSWGTRWGLNGFGRISSNSCYLTQIETIKGVRKVEGVRKA